MSSSRPGPDPERHASLAAMAAFFVVAALAMRPAEAATVETIEVVHEGDDYRVEIDARIEAPRSWVFQVISDFSQLHLISSSILESRVLGVEGGRHEVLVRMRMCVPFYCLEFDQWQQAQSDDGQRVWIEVPRVSENSFTGSALWSLVDVVPKEGSEATRVHFRATMQPLFWVPPLLGPWLIRRTLEREALQMLEGLEALRAAAPRAPTPRLERGKASHGT